MAKRVFTAEQKMEMINEAERPDMGFSAVASKYNLSTSQLYQWRTQIFGGRKTTVSATELPRGYEKVELEYALLISLQNEVAASVDRLALARKNNTISEYNEAIALNTLTSSFAKLQDMREEIMGRLFLPGFDD